MTDIPDKNEREITDKEKKPKHHLIKNKWVRRILKTLGVLLIVILLIPVALYIPPVQTFVKNVACKVVKNSTGMDVEIGTFRLRFPLDVELQKVLVVEAAGDTMVRAETVIADVTLLPLLRLDVKLNRLMLKEGYYRMVSPDSSMIMKVNAGLLDVDNQSFANIATSEIVLNKASLKRGSIDLYMNVWKKEQQPDTATSSTPFLIKANDLELEDFRFGMSMLPTIDTLNINAKSINLSRAVIDLRKNMVTWKMAKVSEGDGEYLVPDPEWVKLHPAPVTPESDSAPMVIKGDSLSLDSFKFLYATDGVKPVAGFDPAYMQFSDVGISLKDFYNESATLRLPITRLEAKERSGLEVVSGKGLVAMDSTGLKIKDIDINTLYSSIRGSADLPFALMELKPEAEVFADISMRLGMPDLDNAVPMVKSYTKMLPARTPLEAAISAEGTLSSVDIKKLEIALRDVVSLKAEGYADNPLDIKKLVAEVEFDGAVSDPRLIEHFSGMKDIHIPVMRIEGEASANRENYAADFHLTTTAGDLVGNGKVSLNSEKYAADLDIVDLNVGKIMPSLGLGIVAGNIKADGVGFNPVSGKAVTSAEINIDKIEYNKKHYADIIADIKLLPDGTLDIYANSNNPGLNFQLDGTGMIKPDDYTFDLVAKLRDIDLQELGVTPEMNNGKGEFAIKGRAMPEKWIYDVDLSVEQFDWNLPNQYIHLPGGLQAKVFANEVSTKLDLNSYLTSLEFDSNYGLKSLIDRFTEVSKMLDEQLKAENLELDKIGDAIPDFNLAFYASGKGVLSQFLVPQGLGMDTLYATISKDSLLKGNVSLLNFSSGTLGIDTIKLNLAQINENLDYALHIGNRPGTLDEFAKVDLDGYVGPSGIHALLTQKNIKGESGYHLGLNATMKDSVLSVKFDPLNSTIAYMPWQFNNNNFVNYHLYTRKVVADLEAISSQSQIILKTQPNDDGEEELYVKLENIRIQDFTNMIIDAPPVAGSINSDLHILYDGSSLQGHGNLGIVDLKYERNRIGDFLLDLNAELENDGRSGIRAGLAIDGHNAVTAYASLRPDSIGLSPDSIGLTLDRFPLSLANSFLAPNASLGGYLDGEMRMDGDFTKPVLNGSLQFSNAYAKITMAGATLNLDTVPVTVTNSLVHFDDFDLIAANNNPICIDGDVNLTDFANILIDMKVNSRNCQLINSDIRSKADLFGKLFINLDATAKGSLNLLDIRANLNILGTSDITYRVNMVDAQAVVGPEQTVVKFVNFNDTAQVTKADSVAKTSTMRIRAGVEISPGTEVTVLLTGENNRVELQPSASLNYFQNYMGDMILNGKLTLGNGFVRYSIPVLGEKLFTFDPTSSISWAGPIMKPNLNIHATDDMKVNVTQGSNSQIVNFLLGLNVTGSLAAPNVTFDLSTNDDVSIQNELQSMTADQRQTTAMNMLLTGTYQGPNASSKSNFGLSTGMLYGYLASKLNAWAAQTIRGVDLSFGVDQYDSTQNGNTSQATSYSYQVSKSLFNNKLKIQVGGNYSTDASADENLSQNLVSDVSMEYMIKQTQTVDMSVRLFRHTGFESILEGEITETGAGFQLKRKLNNLFHIFRIVGSHEKENREREQENDDKHHHDATEVKESVVNVKDESVPEKNDSIGKEGRHE